MSRRFTTLESIVPHTLQSPGTSLGYVFSHTPGDRFAVFQGNTEPGSLALNIYAELEPGIFTVEKSARPTDRQPDEARRWMLEGTRTQIGPTRISGLLLAPSILGQGLFGADKSPGSEVENRFGTISLVVDNFDRSYLLNINMPVPAHEGLGRLVICREAAIS